VLHLARLGLKVLAPQVRQLEQEIRPVVVVPLPEINELLSDFGSLVLCHAAAFQPLNLPFRGS
jgi:hypothetical protein